EDVTHRTPRTRFDLLIRIPERPVQQRGDASPDARLARPGQADEHDVPRHPSRRDSRYVRWLRTSSAIESPPNFRTTSFASTSATMVSATTPIAGTAVTSVRSLKLTVSSFVTTSTVLSTGR